MTARNKRFSSRVYLDEYCPGDGSWSASCDSQGGNTTPRFQADPAVTDMPESEADAPHSQTTLPALDAAGERRDPDGLSGEERTLLADVRALQTIPHLAIRCFLVRGDLRLAQALYDQLFLGLGPQFMSQAGDDVR